MTTDQIPGQPAPNPDEINPPSPQTDSGATGEPQTKPLHAKPFPGIAQAIGLLLLLLFLQILLSVPISFTGLYSSPLALASVILISTGIVVAFGCKMTRAPVLKVFPFAAVRLSILLALMLTVLGLFFLLSQVASLLMRLLPPPKPFLELMGNMVGGRQNYWESLIAVVVVAPFAEETLFRGLILHGFLKRYGFKTAILTSALLFAVLHGNPWQFVPGFCLGILFAWCLARTHSLVPCLFAHMFNNSLGFIILAFQKQSPVPPPGSFPPPAPLQPSVAAAGLILAVLGIGLLKRSFDNEKRREFR